MAEQRTVAIINSSEDIIEALQLFLNEAGYLTVGAHIFEFKKGKKDFVAFCQEHNPQVIIYDIAPPYEENWRFLQLLRNAKEVDGRVFIITTTNKVRLEELVGETGAIEIVGKAL